MSLKQANFPTRLADKLALLLLVYIPLFSYCPTAKAGTAAAPSGLMCEMMVRPAMTRIADPRPEFAWVLNSSVPGDVQTAYQILVASGTDRIEQDQADLWDSGKIQSPRSVSIEYAGKPLSPNTSYRWKVRTWNKDGQAGPYSQTQTFRDRKSVV